MAALSHVVCVDDDFVVGIREVPSKGGEDRFQFGLGGIVATAC